MGSYFCTPPKDIIILSETPTDDKLLPPETPTNTQTPTPTYTSTPNSTPTRTNTHQKLPTNTPTATSSKTKIACFQLVSPQNNEMLNSYGKVHFSWTDQPGAEYYQLEITPPKNKPVIFETPNTFRDQYIEVFRDAGTYSWRVISLSASRSVICVAGPFKFTKQASANPTTTATPLQTDDGSDDSSTSNGGSDSSGSGTTATSTSFSFSSGSDG